MNDYQYWQAATRGEKPKMFVDDPQLGFYRKSINQRNDKGNSRCVGWTPVAVFMVGDVMTARVGDENTGNDVTGDALNELWSYIASNAITEEAYRAVARHGKDWPDAHDPKKNRLVYTGIDLASGPDKTAYTVREPDGTYREATADEIRRAKKSTAWESLKDQVNGVIDIPIDVAPKTPEQKLAREIAEAKAGVSQYETIDSDTMAGQALSLKNTITTLAGDLDRHREALVRPHIDAQRVVNDRLNPIIKDAKAQAAAILKAIGTWEDTKREAARAAESARQKQVQEHAAAALKAKEANEPPPPALEPPKPNAPPPSAQVAAAVGRKASVKVRQFVTAIDLDKAFAQFRNDPAVNATLIALAQRAVDAGLAVDGATIEDRSVVR